MSQGYQYSGGYDSGQSREPQPQVPSQHTRPGFPRQPSSQSHSSDPSSPVMSTAYMTQNDRFPSYPPSLYYGDSGSSSTTGSYMQDPHLHYYPPPLMQDGPTPTERNRPSLSLNLPPPSPFAESNLQLPMGYNPTPGRGNMHPSPVSPYATPYLNSGSGNSGQSMSEYFPPFAASPSVSHQHVPAYSPTWSSHPPPSTNPPKVKKEPGTGGAKTTRQQFTACGACRHRRVKCDLKDRQEQADLAAAGDESRGPGPHRNNAANAAARRKKVSCTNCQERGTNCVDEYAPLKAAKQLRRGKRISEIEMLYGRSAANAAVANNPDDTSSDTSRSPSKPDIREERSLPDLTKAFFDSPFFRRFQVQRPILDPVEFVNRYLSHKPPTAAAMGPEGAILCHVLYAWAVSYGVDENGSLDVPEGGDAPDGPIDLTRPCDGEVKRETDRQRRKANMTVVVEIILKEIDEAGLMRKPTWDGVRALLIILPLTEGISSPVERLAMYEAAISQVFTLCSFIGIGYDGAPAAISKANGGSDQAGDHNMHTVRIRLYWYAFVHEGITTGLKGGRLHLDDEDLETMQESVDSRALVMNSTGFRSAAKFATAPINLALACRLINKALTGPAAKRRQHVNPDAVKAAWESLEACWEEFDSLRNASPVQAYSTQDEIIRFADGWKIFLFEAQNVIRKSLEERLAALVANGQMVSAYIVDPQTDPSSELVNIRHLLDISRSKCEVKTRQILEIAKRHVGTRFFEWDASLVRDGTYYAAMLHAKVGGSDEDIAVCIQALNELRWAHAKAWERSADLRNEWAIHRSSVKYQTWEPAPADMNAAAYYPYQHMTDGYGNHDGHSAPSRATSPYTSPGTTFSAGDMSGPPTGPGAISNGGGVGYIQSQNGNPGFVVYPSTAGPPPLGGMQHTVPPPQGMPDYQGHNGHYVIQPDGSQVYMTYQ